MVAVGSGTTVARGDASAAQTLTSRNGERASGQIAAVGFEMYARLLDETIREMKGECTEEEVETSMAFGHSERKSPVAAAPKARQS